MNENEALKILILLRNWKAGADKRVLIDRNITKEMIVEALSIAIENLHGEEQ